MLFCERSQALRCFVSSLPAFTSSTISQMWKQTASILKRRTAPLPLVYYQSALRGSRELVWSFLHLDLHSCSRRVSKRCSSFTSFSTWHIQNGSSTFRS